MTFAQALRTEFSLSPVHIEHCSVYFLRRWSVGYFLDKMDWNPLELEYEGTRYSLIFLDNLDWRKEFNQVMLSFRKPVTGDAYVLVKGYKE